MITAIPLPRATYEVLETIWGKEIASTFWFPAPLGFFS